MSIKKEELKQNDLAASIEEKLGAIKPYSNIIMLGGLAIVVLVIGILFWISRNEKLTAERWNDFFFSQNALIIDDKTDELEKHATRYPKQESALWALQLAADQKLSDGSRTLYQDRDEGASDIREAIELYDQVLADADKKSMVRGSALMGRAQAYESMLELDKARADFDTILEEFGEDSALGKSVTRRMRLYNNPLLEQFVSDFNEFDPTQPMQSNLNSMTQDGPLPPVPDLSYPMSFPGGDQSSNENLTQPGENDNEDQQLDPLNDPNDAGDSNSGDGTSGDGTSGDGTSGDGTSGDGTSGDGGGAGDNTSGTGNSGGDDSNNNSGGDN